MTSTQEVALIRRRSAVEIAEERGVLWFTALEVAEICGRSAKTVARWARDGRLGPRKEVNGRYHISPQGVDEMFNPNTNED